MKNLLKYGVFSLILMSVVNSFAVEIGVNWLNGSLKPINIESIKTTIQQVKEAIKETSGIPENNNFLLLIPVAGSKFETIYAGHKNNSKTLEELGVTEDNLKNQDFMFHVVLRLLEKE